LSGDVRLRSSSEADEMSSFGTGSGGTMTGSATGVGGAGGRAGVVSAVVIGGGAGRATGGVLLPHATVAAMRRTIRTCAAVRDTGRIDIVKLPAARVNIPLRSG
jgi:hypothetical protein